MPTLSLQPITRDEASVFIRQHHRHHKARPAGWRFGVAVNDGERVVGVAWVGNPVARRIADGFTAELQRCCVLEGYKNAASMLYGACWRAARALGYRRLITYTLPYASGSSLRAAGFTLLGECGGGSWSRKDRLRVDKHPTQAKLKWEKCNADTES